MTNVSIYQLIQFARLKQLTTFTSSRDGIDETVAKVLMHDKFDWSCFDFLTWV